MLPLALQYGMTYDEFWYGEVDYLEIFIKAKVEQMNYAAWLNGRWNYVAYATALSNLFRGKNDQPIEYPNYEYSEKVETKGKQILDERDLQDILLACY